MISIKIIGAILVIGAFYMYGEVLCRREKERLSVLEQMHSLGRIFKAEVRCSISEIDEVFENIRDKVGVVVEEFIKEVTQIIKCKECIDVSDDWRKLIREKLKVAHLKEEDFIVLDRFGENLGYLDRQMQIDNTDLYIEEISKHIKNVSISLKEKAKLYKSISVSIGICIVLILL